MKKVIIFFVIFSLFASGVYAAKTINGTEFKLISNTDQCLSECEAWIEWDLTKGIAQDVQLPDEPDSQFNFELVKENATIEDLDGFGIEVWEDIDGMGWKKVSNNFFRFKAKQGKIYRLRIWGKRKAELGSNATDWIPTFFGVEIKEWALWDSDWGNKIPITLKTSNILSSPITDDLVIPFDINSDQTEFWAEIQASGDDIRFISSDETTEYAFHFEDFNYAFQDLNAWVKVTDTFPSGSDLIVYLYFGNSEATSTEDEQATYAGTDYNAVWHMADNNETGQHNSTADVYDLNHVFTPTVLQPGQISEGIKYESTNSELSDNETVLDDETEQLSISFWVKRPDQWDSSSTPTETLISKSNETTDTIIIKWETDGTLIQTTRAGNILNTVISSKTTWAANTWFQIVTVIDTTGNKHTMYVNGSTTDGDEETPAFGTWAAGTLTDFVINAGDSTAPIQFGNQTLDEIKIFYDKALTAEEVELLYSSETRTLADFGESEILALDFNLSTINGLEYSTHPIFGHGLDGNITIDFNIFDGVNNRLTIDLNNSTSVVRGTGTVIIKDLNLTADICPDQDWDDVPSACSYSWNYSDVTDGNYTILGFANLAIFDVGDGNFEIANDVNLIVSIPINEETGIVIDTAVSSFTVRINANGVLSVFDNQLDINGFMVPIGSDFILVEIDTNTPLLFNSRTYSFLFDEAQAIETLQPYLAPVAASILTTIKVREFENLNPISGVRVRVFKILTEGKTLIHDSLTDGKGETTVPFIVADLYEIDVLVSGDIIFTEQYIATATTNEHFIFISSTEAVVPPADLTTPSVVFTPSQKHFNTVDVNLGVIVSTDLANIASIHFFITNNDFNIFDGSLDTGAVSDGNTYSVNINDLQDVSDTNFAFVSKVIVTLDDGNSFVFSASYSLRPGADEVLNILIYEMRDEFECNTSDLSVRCDGLMFIAFFIVLFVMCAFAAGARGIVGGEGLTILGLVLFGFFTFIAWVPLWVFIVMIFAAVGVILTRTRFIGA